MMVMGRLVFGRHVGTQSFLFPLEFKTVSLRIIRVQLGSKYYDTPSICQALFQTLGIQS